MKRPARELVSCALALALLGAAPLARAVDMDRAPPPSEGQAPEPREVATLAAREAVLSEQVDASRASVRWRLRALSRFVRAGAQDGATRARALDAGTRALARELAESRSLARERDQLRGERARLAAAARDEGGIGPAPALAPPVSGAVLARFGVAPEPTTGLLVARAGVRFAAAPGAAVRAPAAGVIARVTAEPLAASDGASGAASDGAPDAASDGASGGASVVIDAGAGWTIIVGGVADPGVSEGARVALGDRLGSAAGRAGAPAAVSFEVWRGRYPVDPLLVVHAGRPAAAPDPLAAPPSVP